MSHVVIVGNGPAGHRLAERLMHYGHQGTITMIGAEPEPAYNRVLLPSVLAGSLPARAIRLPTLPDTVDIQSGVTATSIDRIRRVVHTDSDVSYRYDSLVLATGSTPRLPRIPGVISDAEVTTLRTLADCGRIAASGDQLVVLGAGVLGVEAAWALAQRGNAVTLVHPQPQLMNQHVDHTTSHMLAGQLTNAGISLRLGSNAKGFGDGGLTLDSGETVGASMLVVCAGVVPETSLALAAGLTVRYGVVVDRQLRTDDRHIYALGDCAEAHGQVSGQITPAWEQAEALARILTGGGGTYHGSPAITRLKAPGIELVSLGDTTDLDTPDPDVELITLSDPARGRYAKLALRGNDIAAATLLGFPQAIATITQLHDRGGPVPNDRLGLLLGTVTGTHAARPGVLPADAVICRCNNVTRQSLTHAWNEGARSVSALAQTTRATTGCGSCADDVRRLCGLLTTATPPRTELIEQEGAA